MIKKYIEVGTSHPWLPLRLCGELKWRRSQEEKLNLSRFIIDRLLLPRSFVMSTSTTYNPPTSLMISTVVSPPAYWLQLAARGPVDERVAVTSVAAWRHGPTSSQDKAGRPGMIQTWMRCTPAVVVNAVGARIVTLGRSPANT